MFVYDLIRAREEEALAADQKNYEKISIEAIRPNPWQPRKYFTQEEIQSLSESIKEYGLIQPITVRKVGNHNYELIAGERRFRAARLAGLTEIDAFVIKATNQESAIMALIENVEREDLHFFEEAAAIEELMKEHNLTQEQVSRRLGKKQSTIANKLRVLKLPKEIKEAIIRYELTERHARAILKLTDPFQQMLAVETAYEKGLNVKKTEALVHSMEEVKSKPKKAPLSKFICDNRLYINSVKSVVKQITDRGVNAHFHVQEESDKLVMCVEILK